MNRLSRLSRRPIALATLLAALALPTLFSTSWATNVNYCPGSPWDCTQWTHCSYYVWCQAASPNCSDSQHGYEYDKELILKTCVNTQTNAVMYCTSCTNTEYVNFCCQPTNTEPACPNQHGCG
jgi:hypothetical protein